jgi:3-dehydroquinate dehydratase/shikimate dehydrogenase
MVTRKRRICVSICEPTIADLTGALAKSIEVGDLVEIRLDCFNEDNFKSSLDQIKSVLSNFPLPSIITFRPAEQGGLRSVNRQTRYAFWSEQGLQLPSHLADIEIDVAEQLVNNTSSDFVNWSSVICSYHEFTAGLRDLAQLYERMAVVPARILKIAVVIDDAIDCLEIFKLLERAKADGREIIAIGMGPAGLPTRILGPSRGAFLTYGALDEASATAPGQISAEDLRTLYRVDEIDPSTQVMGLVGKPVAHSLSPHVHNAAFRFRKINAVYVPFEVTDLRSFFNRMVHPRTREMEWDMRGLSITAPHKIAVMNHLDWIEPGAKDIGSVNTVVVEDGRLCGYNTDATAIIQTLVKKVGSLDGAEVAIIGAGGVSRAALQALKQHGAKTTVFARDQARANSIAASFGATCQNLREASFNGFDIVINATPAGTSGQFETVTPVTAAQLGGARLAYDLVYNPIETQFLREATDAGCETLGGLSMFIAQAAEQFRLWTGTAAPEQVMSEAAEQVLRRQVKK